MFWWLGFDTQTAVATAPNRNHAHSDCTGCSGVFIHGLIKPGTFSLGDSGAEELLSFQASAFRSQEKQTREPTPTAGSRNRLNIEIRRQERRPVFFKQTGEQEVGSEGNGKSQGKKWEGHGCSEEAVAYTRQIHMLGVDEKPSQREHAVSAGADTSRGKKK